MVTSYRRTFQIQVKNELSFLKSILNKIQKAIERKTIRMYVCLIYSICIMYIFTLLI